MKEHQPIQDPLSLAQQTVRILYRKKAHHLRLFHVKDDTVITDYEVIATGRSSTHLKSLADDLCADLNEQGICASHVEGRDGGAWILVDLGCVIVHLFDEASRSYYNLERLRRQETLVDIAPLLEQEEAALASGQEN